MRESVTLNVRAERRTLIGFVVDLIAPLAMFWLTRRLGVPIVWGLVLGSAVAIVSTVVNTVRRGKIDGVGVLVFLEMAVSIGLLFWLKDPRLILVKPSFYSGIAAIYLIVSACSEEPLSFEASEPMATKGDAVRVAAWRKAWRDVPKFRRAHKLLTLGWGLAAMTDAVLRVVVVYRFPVERAAWLAHLPHVAAIAVMLGVSVLFGRWAGRLVDAVQHGLASQA